MKKVVVLILTAAIVLTLGASLAACNDTGSGDGYSYVSLKINSQVEFVVDGNGKVVTAYAANEDAAVLLEGTDFEGKTIEDAAQQVVDMATEAGYIDVDTAGEEVDVSAVDDEGNEDTEIYGSVEKTLNDYFVNNGIFGRVSKDTLDAYLDEAEASGLSVGHIKIIMLACDVSGKTFDALKDKPVSELRKIINAEKGNNGKGAGKQERINTRKQKCAENADKIAAHKADCQENSEEIAARIRNYQQEE